MPRTTIINKNAWKKLDFLIEQKVLEILGDPDNGLDLRPDFKTIILRRLKTKSKRITHQDIIKRFG